MEIQVSRNTQGIKEEARLYGHHHFLSFLSAPNSLPIRLCPGKFSAHILKISLSYSPKQNQWLPLPHKPEFRLPRNTQQVLNILNCVWLCSHFLLSWKVLKGKNQSCLFFDKQIPLMRRSSKHIC